MKKIKEFQMPYNSQLERLIMPEYGRNVHQLVEYAKTIPNREYRQAFCEEIINLIQQLYPQAKNVEDYRDKLWQHLFQIAGYDIDITPPNGEIKREDMQRKRPEPMPYPKGATSLRHYGNNVRSLIQRAVEMEDSPIKEGFVNAIASYMKLAYRTWNREHFVSDELIKTDLETLSKGMLRLEDHETIENLSANKNKSTNNYSNKNQLKTNKSNNNTNNAKPNNNISSNNNNNNNNNKRKRL
jgi:hypothetical protein